MVKFKSIAGAAVVAILILPSAAKAENVKVFGWELGIAEGPGFRPAGTRLTCAAISPDGECWDGKTWQRLFPSGPRHYSQATGQVACRIILPDDGSCWDGRAWYRLPSGSIHGWQAGMLSQTPGAFITTPLPPE
jgi:hypothetical protein